MSLKRIYCTACLLVCLTYCAAQKTRIDFEAIPMDSWTFDGEDEVQLADFCSEQQAFVLYDYKVLSEGQAEGAACPSSGDPKSRVYYDN
jgi:hypothetical protein